MKLGDSQAAILFVIDRALNHQEPNFLQGYCLIKILTFFLPEQGGNNGGKNESKIANGAVEPSLSPIPEGSMEGKGQNSR
ncbi:MAG: hypothetical protein HC888_09945 [Candidatus Competibacteraceae bacterium]|nr:hypothetical protein [Candidatus Competibacteraceae bacterium]